MLNATRTRKDRERYRNTIALSKANQEDWMRNIIKTVDHRPLTEIAQIVRERTGIAADPDFIRQVLSEAKR